VRGLISFDQIAHIGTFLQGLAAILALVGAVLSGSDILQAIDDLKTAVNQSSEVADRIESAVTRIESISKDTNDRIKKIEIPDSGEEASGALERKSWEEELKQLPETPNSDSTSAYIPNKEAIIEQLVSIKKGPNSQLKKAELLKNSIRLSPKAQSKGITLEPSIVQDRKGTSVILEYSNK
jgi:hypothetical protein